MDQERVKSWVRITVTYMAALFVFVGGAIIVVVLCLKHRFTEAVAVFQTVVAIGASTIAYWFAGRGKGYQKPGGGNQ